MWPRKRKPQLSANERVIQEAERLWIEAKAAGVSEDDFATAVVDALGEAVDPFVDTLLRDSPKMLRNRRRIERGFERRLARRWGKALNLYRVTLEVALEAGSDFNRDHRPAAVDERDFLFEAVTRLHARACLTGFEVYRLLRSGFSDAAYARWRTLHELAVVASLLVQETNDSDLAERYLLHERAEHAADVPSYQRHAPALGYEPFDEETVAEHRKTQEVLERRFGSIFLRRNGWAAVLFGGRPPTFADLEERAGLGHMRPWYKLTSHKVHAGSKGAGLNVKERGPHTFLLSGPSNADLADPGHGALISLAQVTVSLLLNTRTESLSVEPFRIVTSRALLRLTELAGDAFLAAHQKLEADESALWVDVPEPLTGEKDDQRPETRESGSAVAEEAPASEGSPAGVPETTEPRTGPSEEPDAED